MNKIYHTIGIRQPFADRILHGEQKALLSSNYKEAKELLVCVTTDQVNDGHLLCLAEVKQIVYAPYLTPEQKKIAGYPKTKPLWGYWYELGKIKPVIELPVDVETYITEKAIRDVQEYPQATQADVIEMANKYNLWPKKTKRFIFAYVVFLILLLVAILALFWLL